MKRNCHWIILISLIGIPGVLFGADANDERAAATFFHNQQYQEALHIWQQMVNKNSNAGLYFDIGLAESNLHQHAEAIYAFEQALRLRPLHATYLKAIEEERKKLDNPVIPLNPFFLENWYLAWITFLRPGSWAILGLLLLLSALISYLISIHALPVTTRVPRTLIRWFGVAGSIVLVTAFLSVQHLCKRDEGIIMSACELKQASSGDSPALRLLSAGEKVRIKDQIGEWYYVVLLNLDYGWIKRDSFKIITVSEPR